MPLPDDYDSQDGEVQAEMTIRTAIRDMMLTVAAPYGFEAEKSHTRPRYPDTPEQWNAVAMIEDPRNDKNTLLRYIDVRLRSFKSENRQLTISYAMAVAVAFEDERRDTDGEVTGNSTDDLIAVVFKIRKFFQDNQNLGLGDAVMHKLVQLVDMPFTAADAQGRPAQKAALTLDVVMNIC